MRVPIHNIHRLAGLGDAAADCARGDAAACGVYYSTVYAKAPSVVATVAQPISAPDLTTAVDFPQAPGCHVVNLAKNACMLDNGIVAGCNSMVECDPLTGAQHGATVPLVNNPAFDASLVKGVTPAGGVPYTPTMVVTPASPVTRSQIQSVTQAPVKASTPAGGSVGGGGAAGGAQAGSTAGFDLTAFLKQTSIDGIPNWVPVAAGVMALLFVGYYMATRRAAR